MADDPREPESCSECGVPRGMYQKQIRRLWEKLEHAELRAQQLAVHCSQLEEALKVARLQGASSLEPRKPPPALPNELLREIFEHAIAVDDFAFSPWNMETTGRSWSVSSRTRRSIPLVCRQWHTVGLEFLYDHVVLQTPSQIIHLTNLLHSLKRKQHTEHFKWIHGLELVPTNLPEKSIVSYWNEAHKLVLALPLEALQLFGMDALEWPSTVQSIAENIVAIVCWHAEKTLRFLHVPCTGRALSWNHLINLPEIDLRHSNQPTPQFPKLQTLSTTNGRWNLHKSSSYTRVHPLSALIGHVPELRSLSMNWSRNPGHIIELVQSTPQLTRVHIGPFDALHLFRRDYFDMFLHCAPNLEHLTITTTEFHWQYTKITELTNPNIARHERLQEIVLSMNNPVYYKAIPGFWDIFLKIQKGQFPALRRIALYGPFNEGCLDTSLIISPTYLKLWREAIETCAKHDVRLVNIHGDVIHLWSDRHGIKFDEVAFDNEKASMVNEATEATEDVSEEAESEEETTSSGYSDEDEWYETDDQSGAPHSADSDDEISNDSGDAAYRYQHQPDVELVDSDLEESTEDEEDSEDS